MDVGELKERAQAAIADLSDAAEDAKRRGLEALVSLGDAAQAKLDEGDGEDPADAE